MLVAELKHFSHDHTLKLECNEIPFTCDGCLERGWGPKYRCDYCDYDLHKDCALAPPFTSHPFYKKCTFEFLQSAPDNHYCNACGRDVQGFVYHCSKNKKGKRGLDLHPSCANLPLVLKCDGVKLHLHESLSSECGECGRKEPKVGSKGWSYRSSSKKYHFHVSCVKDMVVKKWERDYYIGGVEMMMSSWGVEISDQFQNLQLNLKGGRSSGGRKWSKYWKIAKIVLEVIISTVIGDPVSGMMTSLITSLLIN